MNLTGIFLRTKKEKGVKNKMQGTSTIRRDFILSHLRAQTNKLRTLLLNLEESGEADYDYAEESLKDIETNLRQARKLCEAN